MSNINVSVEKTGITTYYDFTLNNNGVERSGTVAQSYDVNSNSYDFDIISLYGGSLNDEERKFLFNNI